MWSRRIAVLAALVLQAFAQSLPSQSDLTSYLLPATGAGTNTTSTTTIRGQTLELYPFNLSVLTNESHALVSISLKKAVSDVGYVAVGFGSSMSDSAMVLLWPAHSGSNWTISLRSADGHSDPTDTGAASSFATVPSLTATSGSSSTVSFIRPLIIPADNSPFPHSKYLNMSRDATAQRLIYAFTAERPSSMEPGSDIAQHDGGSFGSTAVDLTNVFGTSTVGSWTRYDTVVMVHAGLAVAAWIIVAPLAVLIGRLGRNWGSWFKWHSSMQGYFVVPATAAVVALGLYSSRLGYSTAFSGHKIIGFVVLGAVIVQGLLGYWAHRSFVPNRPSRPAPNWLHLVLGVTTLLLSWLQIALGFNEYSDRPVPLYIPAIIAAFALLCLLIFLGSALKLVLARHREGRSWVAALTGLGRDAAGSHAEKTNRQPQQWSDELQSLRGTSHA